MERSGSAAYDLGKVASPIMVGQQVQLQASPSSVTGVQWAFDYTTATSVVANSSVGNNQSVGTPSPVQSSGNPNSFYWVSTVGTIGNGLRYVRMSESVSGVTGPLFADVYYPIGGPSASISFTTAAVQDSNATFGNPNDFPVGCPTPWVTYYAMHLGGSCGSPQPTPGILTNYSVGIPSYGAGELAIAQLLTLVFTGTKSTGELPSLNTRSARTRTWMHHFPTQWQPHRRAPGYPTMTLLPYAWTIGRAPRWFIARTSQTTLCTSPTLRLLDLAFG
jgi:hypothetical protein